MKRSVAFLVSGSLLTSAWAAYQVSVSSEVTISTQPLENETYVVAPSTPTAAELRQMRRFRPRRPPLKRLEEMPRKIQRVIKKTSPNPKVHSPSPSAMPSQAPEMPAGPTMPAQPSKTERFLGAASKVMTKSWGPNLFVWLPAVSTDPNAGPTGGFLPVMLLEDPVTHHIRHLFAPSYTYNDLFGQTGTWRYYYYPTDASQLFTLASYSEHTNREAKVRYENSAARDGVLYLNAESYYSADASNRFFGIGPQTSEGDETGYTSKDSVARAAVGINFEHSWRATIGTRFRRFSTDDNIIPDTTNLTDRFPTVPGIGTKTTIAQEIRLLWDTRDSPVTPSRGSSGEFFGEKTSVAMGSDSDFVRYGLEGKSFFLWNNPDQVTVIRGRYERVNGSYIPFYELAQLGGRDSLRGYGEGRFADRGSLVFNLEQRYTFASVNLMNIQTHFEAAPFFDLGSVFADLQDMMLKDYRPVTGMAFRAAVKPNVVGDVEVGVGKEGPAVFVDINYPY
jgi:hypothetical protein